MAEINCIYHADHHNRIEKLEDVTEDLDDRFTNFEKQSMIMQERNTIALESLTELPAAIYALRESNMELKNEVKEVKANVGNLQEDVKKDISNLKTDVETVKTNLTSTQEDLRDVDGKSKFDTWSLIKDNKLAVAIMVLWIIKESTVWINSLIK